MVLRSNNFEKYKPKIVLVKLKKNKIADHLDQHGYSIFAKTVNTVFFINSSFKKDKLL